MTVIHLPTALDRDPASTGQTGWNRALRGFLSRINLRLDRAYERKQRERLRADADYVRGLAGRWMYLSPGMAADLRAAADRHEREQGL